MTKDNMKIEIKTRLGEYKGLRKDCALMREKILQKQEDIAYLRTVMQEGARYSREILRQAETAVGLMERLTSRYVGMMAKREEAEQRILDMLDKVENNEGRRILYMHYIEGRPFDEIPGELDISDRTMWYKYKLVIEELCTLAEKRQADTALVGNAAEKQENTN